jgi:hypothetical protein
MDADFAQMNAILSADNLRNLRINPRSQPLLRFAPHALTSVTINPCFSASDQTLVTIHAFI